MFGIRIVGQEDGDVVLPVSRQVIEVVVGKESIGPFEETRLSVRQQAEEFVASVCGNLDQIGARGGSCAGHDRAPTIEGGFHQMQVRVVSGSDEAEAG